MGKHDKFNWQMPQTEQPAVISFDPPKDDFYKARISALEKENLKLRAEIEKRANWYGIGKDAFDTRESELVQALAELREKNERLEKALIREAVRDV